MPELPREPFTRADLRTLGLSRARIHRGMADGSLRQVLRGVYVRSDLPDSYAIRAWAAAKVVPAHHVVVDRTAAWLHGVDSMNWSDQVWLPPVELCAWRGFNPTARTGTRSGERDLAPHDVMALGAITLTTPLRTALDLGCRLRRRHAYATLNTFAANGLRRDDILADLGRFKGRRGVIQLRELSTYLEPKVESPRESWALLAMIDAGLPAPEAQVVVIVAGEEYRLDFAYRALRLAIEYDGEEFHSTAAQRADDSHRREQLKAAGWHVIALTAEDMYGDRLDRWLRVVRERVTQPRTNARW